MILAIPQILSDFCGFFRATFVLLSDRPLVSDNRQSSGDMTEGTRDEKVHGGRVAVSVVASLVAGVARWASGLPHEVDGYARATAETVAEKVEAAIPDEIKDKKLDHEVRSCPKSQA